MAEVPTPVDRVREAYRIWSESKGTVSEQWLDLIHDDIGLRSVLSAEVPDDIAGERRSRVGVLEYFQTIARDWEMVSFDCERFIDGGDDVVMIGRCAWRNRATAKLFETPKVDVWRFEDGYAVSFLEMFDSLGFMKAIPFGAGIA
ncbi:MAG: nuclear transport factor 2 family protein [Alphaproteobacteria bacterium]|nr:nuclear transport factor 2 family protein [Alphaproteobacteria bacterium]